MNKSIKELLALHFFNDGIRTTFTILLPFIAKDLSLNLVYVGFLGSSQPLIASILAIPTGFIASRIGGFKLLVTLLIVYSLGALGIALSPNVFILFVAFFIGALGFGMFHTVGFSLVARNSTPANIGRAMGDFTSIGEIGRVALPPLAVFATSLIGWRYTMAILAGVGILAYIFFRFFNSTKDTYDLVDKSKGRETHSDFIKNLVLLLKKRKFMWILCTGIIDSFASSPIYIFLPFLLLAKGISVAQYGIITGAFFVGSLFGKAVLGRAVDQFGNTRIFIISEVLMAIVLIFITFNSSLIILLVLAFLLGVFTKGTSPVVQSIFSQVAHKDHYNKVYGVSELCTGMSAMASIILLGIVANTIGVVSVFYITAFFAFLAIFPIILFTKTKKD